MAIDINKGKEKTAEGNELTSTRIGEMSDSIRKICTFLSCPHSEFEVKKAFDEIKNYVTSYDRLLYAEISTYCYGLGSEQSDNFQGNLSALLEYTYSWNFENGLASLKATKNTTEIELRQKTKRIIIKLYDHVNLASAQMSTLKRSEEEISQALNKYIEPVKHDITKDMSSQLITLVGIFTAIAFLVFGGFDSLLSIFSNLTTQPIPKTIMVSSLWGLLVCNGLFILLSCIERITQKDDLTKPTIKSSISQWSNLILLTIFATSTWIYFIDQRNLGGWLIALITKYNYSIATIGLVIIASFFLIGIICLTKKKK